jgi:ABC-2 type transport system permease protein
LTSPETAAPRPEPYSISLAARRIYASILRYLYLLLQSWPRMVELIYWPTLNMLVWGFITHYLWQQQMQLPMAFGILLGAAIMLDVMVRGQMGVILSFMEEIWSRNLGNLFVSPIRPLEYISSLIALSCIRTAIAITPCIFFAMWLFDYSLFSLGLPLIGFIAILLMTGWWGGTLLTCIILRWGQGAEWLVWMFAFVMSPIVAVYYPVTVLPQWLQYVAWSLPPTYVFEGMRAIVNEHTFRADLMITGFALNIGYLVLSAMVFLYTFNVARKRGGLLHYGE